MRLIIKCRRGTVAPAAISLILIFAIISSSLYLIIMNHIQLSYYTKAVNEVINAKAKESLTIQTSTSDGLTTINATNIGSTSSLIIAVLAVNPTDGSLSYYKLNPPVGVRILREKIFQVLTLNITNIWAIGVLTSLGNTFWED